MLAGEASFAIEAKIGAGMVPCARLVILVAGLAAAALPACQPCGSCDLATLPMSVVSGTVTTATGSSPPQDYTLSPIGGVSNPAGCYVMASTVVAPDNQVQQSMGPTLACTLGANQYLLSLSSLKDLRTLKAGIGNGMLGLAQTGSSDDSCTGSGSSMSTFSYDVTRADGGSADYPALVTPDYVRDISVHFNTTISTSCGAVSISGDMEFAQKASDVRQHAGCVCE